MTHAEYYEDEVLFGELYLRYEENIIKILNSKRIFNEDLFHDTYIALYEHSQHNEITDFVNAYVEFYGNLLKRQERHESHYDCHDNTHMLNFDRPDDSDLAYREQVGKRVDSLIRYYATHPQPGERSHSRSCKILRLYRQGLTEVEISNKLKISQPTVHQHLDRIIERLKAIAK